MKDSKYVSTEPHEIERIAGLFISEHNEAVPVQCLYFIHYLITVNKKKVLRTEFYQILGLMGYTKRPKE